MQNTLVLMADFINEMVDPKGAFGAANAPRLEADNTLANANRIIGWARQYHQPIVHVRLGFDLTHYHECPPHSPLFSQAPKQGVLKLGTWSTAFHPTMNIQPQDMVVTKHRVSALYGTNLAVILRSQAIERVVICGISTTYVVESTARELHDRDYSVVVIGDGCNAASQASHEASLAALSRIVQVSNADDFIKQNSL